MSKVKKLDLPHIYTEYIWKMGGSTPEYKKFIGYPYISNSQASTFNDSSGFNTHQPGHLEWIQEKLLGFKYPDVGWAQFGKEVEGVICQEEGWEEYKDNFTEEELKILQAIQPLDIQQKQIIVDFTEFGFVVLGYIDDMNKPNKDLIIKILRDYKTASKSSASKYGGKKDFQMDLYNKGLSQLGYTVEKTEYFIIDRGGGGPLYKDPSLGRKALHVKGILGVKEPKLKSWDTVEKVFVKTAKEMEKYYKTYKQLIN